ncbi:glycoside hydrolase family 32 protein [Fictibacillus phosphorivorans]|uniref:glycoside hydrolase family 32 protein n=1 Tax=Fictibacillus phosphorivorans TaxID=1221500 RepID=UPI0011A718DD
MYKNDKWPLLFILSLLVAGMFLVNHLMDESSKPVPKKENDPSYRADYHFTTPDKWKNDPQKPVYYKGKYHYYYLYNKDYPDGNGTEWRHATSEDLVNWRDEGVAIPKFTNDNGDVWSGSVVIDKENTAGFGKNAFIAILTQPSKDGGKQKQFLWYSTDEGKTFKPHGEDPVLDNPGTKDFRDPKVVWDDERKKWIMLMAEGTKIGFYESDDLKNWRFTSGFQTKEIGMIECPDLFLMRAEDGTLKWVLGVSANGLASGKPNTYAYWTGDFNGEFFAVDHEEPEWLDHGFDWYGGVTFDEGEKSDPDAKRYALAWMNNWSYPHETPTMKEDFNGMDSVVRELQLKRDADADRYYLASQPVAALDNFTSYRDSFQQIKVDGEKTLDVSGDSYVLETDISWEDSKNIGLRLRESEDKNRHIDVGIHSEGQFSYVNRSASNQPDKSGQYVESKAPFSSGKQNVHLKILVDKTSVEVFVDDGRVAHSSLVYPEHNDQGITLFSDGGEAIFENLQVKHVE